MTTIPFHNNWYSDVIIYDERKKYFYMWARKNKPLLDDEVRNMNLSIIDQVRRSMQRTYGDVGAPTNTYSKRGVAANDAFKIIESQSNPSDNFIIRGGGGIENPAVLFVRGFYVFLMGDIEYINQNNLGDLTDDDFTETPIPDINPPTPGSDRVDIVYLDLHFSEASAVPGPGRSEYLDSNLKNPIVGSETASRARAVFDIRVWEDWRFKHVDGSPRSPSEIANLRITENIFNYGDFLGSVDTEMETDPNPINKNYRVPLAVLYRRGGQHAILDSDIINLLDLYDKRTLSLQELTYRASHGGYTQRDVDELNLMNTYAGLTGLVTASFPNAVVDESAYASGPNYGFGSESFNSGSVTPRVLDNDGKFSMGGLLVGRETGIDLYPVTGPEGLNQGEIVAKDLSAKSIYVGYDRNVPGVREYNDRVNINLYGLTGADGLAIINKTGETGTNCVHIETLDNSIKVDYKGRFGINTDEPGWTGPDGVWKTESRFTGTSDAVNIVSDINDSARITQHLFVDKDSHVKRDSYGPTWKIPGVIDRETPAIFGVTGMPKYGITGSSASVQVVPGIAVRGVTGIVDGYTGTYGFYESYNPDGERAYSIGSEGSNFDRQVQSLYGTSDRDLFQSDVDFMHLPENFVETSLAAGDIITYSITLLDDSVITRTVGPLASGGFSGLSEIVEDINSPAGAGFHRTFTYQYAKTRGYGETGPITYITKSGEAFGAAICYSDPDEELYLRLLVKSMPEIDKGVEDVSLSINRFAYAPDLPVTFSKISYYGDSLFGGDIIELRFVKFDLGEAADAFLFNGDVYFNGGGLLDKVTFSPKAIFRDDVYVYGKVVAERLMIQLAKFMSLQVDRDAEISQYISVVEGIAVGYGPYTRDGIFALSSTLNNPYGIKFNLKELVNGGIRATNINLIKGSQPDLSDFGVIWEFVSSTSGYPTVYAIMNGNANDVNNPFGIHLKDNGSVLGALINTFVLDGSDSNGNYFNILAWIKGDLRVGTSDSDSTGAILSKRLTLGLGSSEVDNTYILSLKSGTAYIDNLTVRSLQYDMSNPTSAAFFTNPQNIIVVQPSVGDTAYNKSNGITRRKEFSFDTLTNPPAVLSNLSSLGAPDGYDYAGLQKSPSEAVWAQDNLTFRRSLIEGLSASRGDNTITTSDFNVPSVTLPGSTTPVPKWQHYRDNFARIIIANFGTLKISWKGYDNILVYDSDNGFVNSERDLTMSKFRTGSGNLIDYKFSSSLFKSSTGGDNTFNWDQPINNFVTSIRASFNDKVWNDNALYNLNKMLGIFISPESWKVREYGVTPIDGLLDPQEFAYYERLLYYPYSGRKINFNVADFDKQNDTALTTQWQVAIYPRIIQQKMYNVDTQNVPANSDVKIYEGLWNIDVVIYPNVTGSCNNLVGDLLISYM